MKSTVQKLARALSLALPIEQQRIQTAQAMELLSGCVGGLDLDCAMQSRAVDAICAAGDALREIEAQQNKAEVALCEAIDRLRSMYNRTTPAMPIGEPPIGEEGEWV